ncbi:MAG TPA: hypothetical protein VIL74_08400 [Pyrinomonadaceae bacterium]|jgi:hypothetical protein
MNCQAASQARIGDIYAAYDEKNGSFKTLPAGRLKKLSRITKKPLKYTRKRKPFTCRRRPRRTLYKKSREKSGHPDSRWNCYGANLRRSKAEFNGRAEVGRFFERILERLEITEFNADGFVA